MKRTLRLLLTVGLSLVCVSLFAQKFPNYPIPQQPDTLRILGIGNSFTDDGMMYLPELLEAAGIRNVVLGRLYIAGCSLERHCREYAGNAPAYIYYKSTSNRWETVSKKATLLDGIADERWDVVVLQQASGKSGIYPTYQPWFGRLVEIVRWCCPNAGACIAWQQTWAYARNSQHRDFGRYEKNQQLMYRGIVSSVEQLMRETSVEVVVPSGTAIQDLRNTALCDSLDLTRDGYHLNPGTGRYTAACATSSSRPDPSISSSCRWTARENRRGSIRRSRRCTCPMFREPRSISSRAIPTRWSRPTTAGASTGPRCRSTMRSPRATAVTTG